MNIYEIGKRFEFDLSTNYFVSYMPQFSNLFVFDCEHLYGICTQLILKWICFKEDEELTEKIFKTGIYDMYSNRLLAIDIKERSFKAMPLLISGGAINQIPDYMKEYQWRNRKNENFWR